MSRALGFGFNRGQVLEVSFGFWVQGLGFKSQARKSVRPSARDSGGQRPLVPPRVSDVE